MAGAIGNLALFFSALFNVLLIVYLVKRIKNNDFKNLKIINFFNDSIFFLLLISFIILVYCFVISDFSNVAVYKNSHTTKPLIYKISGAWGNHEGSMVLFILILSLFSFIFARTTIDDKLKFYTVFFQKRFAQNRFNKLVSYSRPYLIDAIKSAYNALNTPSDGRGQVIGILIDRVPNSLDLIRFWRLNNQSTSLSRVSNINVNNLRLGPANGEETLDVQWSSGIAPGSRVNVYATGLLTFSAVERGLDRIFYDVLRTPTLRQISISLGIGERYLTPGELISKNDKYLRLRALGVNIFVSSGDSGSHPSGVLQVEFPASNPNVISVGGTNLNIDSNGNLVSESAWTKSGGGRSYVYEKQTYQNILPGQFRLVPDVSAVGDQSTGVCVILNGMRYQFGGTSVGAPIWAGFCALINSSRAARGKAPIGFLLPHLYSLIGTQNFRDISSGSNGQYPSIVGHDMVTGLGTPNVKNLIDSLINL